MIPNEIRTKIFASYLGCEVVENELILGFKLNPSFLKDLETEEFDGYKLLLKSLSDITDEDANLVAEFRKNNFYLEKDTSNPPKNLMATMGRTICESNGFCWQALQYLQSKFYALPYLNYSVEDLINANVYKICNYGKAF